MSKTAVIIPARYSSTRFPGKALFVIAGKPLIQHVFDRCRKARLVDRIIVATDDMRIAECAFDFGAEVALTPSKLPSGTDRVAFVAARLEKTPIIINVQGDEPLVDPRVIDRLVEVMRAHRDVPMITAATQFPKDADVSNPHAVKVVLDRNGDALYFSRSVIPYQRDAMAASKPLLYLRHLGIYGYRRKFLLQLVKMKPTMLEQAEQLEQLRALHCGVRIRVLTTHHLSPGVDTPEDVPKIEALLKAKAAKAKKA